MYRCLEVRYHLAPQYGTTIMEKCSLNTFWTSAYKLSLLSSFLTELGLQLVELGY